MSLQHAYSPHLPLLYTKLAIPQAPLSHCATSLYRLLQLTALVYMVAQVVYLFLKLLSS